MTISSYRDLRVWQKAMDLVAECYKLTQLMPNSERFGLASQLQRAAVSVPANIAEGRGRRHTKEFIHHLSIAHGSLCECETHLLIAARLKLIPEREVTRVLAESSDIGRMINALQNALRKRAPNQGKSPKRECPPDS